jgi:hypothetical protein
MGRLWGQMRVQKWYGLYDHLVTVACDTSF